MAKRSDHSGGTALKTRPRAGRIVLWAVLAALLLGAVIGVVSLLGRPSGTETPENTAAPTAAPDTSGTPSETPLPEELREAPLSPEAEIAASAAVRSNGFPMLAWAPDGFSADSRGRMQYSGGKYLTGIDVSEHQYDIDWEKVAADGIDFAMIRVGYRGSTAGQIYTDEYFEKNIAGLTAAGLKVGVYFYSQAINAEEAAEKPPSCSTRSARTRSRSRSCSTGRSSAGATRAHIPFRARCSARAPKRSAAPSRTPGMTR